jgi:hypothetical protein
VVLVGDGVKQSKEGRRMPGVKKHHQESENSSKAQYIFGQLFGAVGILIGSEKAKLFCAPLALTIQDGVKAIFNWDDEKKERQGSHVEEMIKLAFHVAQNLGENAYVVLDRYFFSVVALNILKECNAAGGVNMQIIAKCKSSCMAYEPPPNRSGKRGRPKRKGDAVKLKNIFDNPNYLFNTCSINLYGQEKSIRYICLDLLWGKKLYQQVRFVLTEYDSCKSILVSTDLTLDPIDIIKIYEKRFGIELMFREMKQGVHAFSHRFWSKSIPLLNRFRKKTDPDPMESIIDDRDRDRIRNTLNAQEGYVACCSIAFGLTQLLSLIRLSCPEAFGIGRWQRTPSVIWSESMTADYLRKHLFALLLKAPDSAIRQIIQDKQKSFFEDKLVC